MTSSKTLDTPCCRYKKLLDVVWVGGLKYMQLCLDVVYGHNVRFKFRFKRFVEESKFKRKKFVVSIRKSKISKFFLL